MLIHKLPEELLEYQKLARDFASRQMRKVSHGAESSDFPLELIKAAWESGLLNMSVPEEFGGLGLGALENCVIAEELAWGEAGIAGSIEGSEIAQCFVLTCGTKEQQAEFLSPLVDAPSLAGYGMDSGVKSSRLFYRKDGDEYFINGKHGAIVNGGVGEWYIVKAYEDRRETPGSDEGQGAYFIVPGSEDGLEFDGPLAKVGKKSQMIAPARFDEVLVPASNMLGAPGQVKEIYNKVLVKIYPMIASGMVGIARSAMEHALKYAKERKTFGQMIGAYQGVSFMLADMAKDIEAARLLVYQAAQLADMQKPSIPEALCAKAFAQEMAMRVTTDAVQVFGGYGFSKEYPVEKLMRDAKVGQLTEGTSESIKVAMGRELVTSI